MINVQVTSHCQSNDDITSGMKYDTNLFADC